MIKRVGKRGDTLIEVMLAVGIFSMVAVAVVAVMSGGTSSAQTALETTLAREEIDAQAEALRFIQASYIADKNSGDDSKYSKLWKAITAKSYNYSTEMGWSDITEELSQYSPSSCSELYENNNNIPEAREYGFVLNTRKLGTFGKPEDVIATGNYLSQASTYPHLVFSDDNGQLAGDSFSDNLQQAEGIYIIAVKDPESTTIAGSESNSGKESAYFDFYIRTCWYGTGDQTPSTISTVMRLYDPDAIKEIEIKPQINNSDTETTPEENTTDFDSSNPYAISASGDFANINGRYYTRPYPGPALQGYVCHTWPSDVDGQYSYFAGKTYVGPILVSTNPNAVTYKISDHASGSQSGGGGTTAGGIYDRSLSATGNLEFNGHKYYYSSWQGWMELSSCSQAKSATHNGEPLYVYSYPTTAPNAVKNAAEQLLKDATAK